MDNEIESFMVYVEAVKFVDMGKLWLIDVESGSVGMRLSKYRLDKLRFGLGLLWSRHDVEEVVGYGLVKESSFIRSKDGVREDKDDGSGHECTTCLFCVDKNRRRVESTAGTLFICFFSLLLEDRKVMVETSVCGSYKVVESVCDKNKARVLLRP